MLIGTGETVFSLLCLLAGAFLLGLSFWYAKREERLQRTGREVRGLVVTVKRRDAHSESGGYTLVSYKDHTGELRTKRVYARSGVQKGDSVTVWYSHDDPTRAATELDIRVRRTLTLCGTLSLAVGLLGVGVGVLQALA